MATSEDFKRENPANCSRQLKAIKQILVLTVFFFSVSATFARLGENETQLEARFGIASMRSQHSIFAQGKIVPLGPALFFKQDDWLITCDMVNGHCVRIHYYKPGDWTETQFKTVLEANAQDAHWSEKSKPQTAKFLRVWKRSDSGNAEWKRGAEIVLTSPAYLRSADDASAKAKAEASRAPKI